MNVGNPGQGYAVVAQVTCRSRRFRPVYRTPWWCASRSPTSPSSAAGQPAEPDGRGRGAYISDVSYGQASLVPAFRGPIALDHNKDYYYHPDRNLLIELTEEVVAKLVAAEPNISTTSSG